MGFHFCRNRDSLKNGTLISIRRTGDGFHPGLFMNADLASKNYYVILGQVPTRYVEDKIYGLEHVEQYLKEDKAI